MMKRGRYRTPPPSGIERRRVPGIQIGIASRFDRSVRWPVIHKKKAHKDTMSNETRDVEGVFDPSGIQRRRVSGTKVEIAHRF